MLTDLNGFRFLVRRMEGSTKFGINVKVCIHTALCQLFRLEGMRNNFLAYIRRPWISIKNAAVYFGLVADYVSQFMTAFHLSSDGHFQRELCTMSQIKLVTNRFTGHTNALSVLKCPPVTACKSN